MAAPSWALDAWGEKAGYPKGWGPAGALQKWEGYPEYHVGNFSGGLESMLAHQTIQASATPLNLTQAPRKIKANFFMDAADYANRFNRTGLLIARGDEIWHEQYRFNRTADMRFFGWSMTKSVVGLLVGIALDEGEFASVDDPIEKYVPPLQGHPFAGITLRNLLNMTSGIDICEAYCSPSTGFERYGYSQIGYSPRRGVGTDQRQGILQFTWGRHEAQGMRFNYTDLCPVLIAWALESAYQQGLPVIAQDKLWQPLGAQAKATWLTDSKGFTFSGAGLLCHLARLGPTGPAGGATWDCSRSTDCSSRLAGGDFTSYVIGRCGQVQCGTPRTWIQKFLLASLGRRSDAAHGRQPCPKHLDRSNNRHGPGSDRSGV